MVWVGRRLEVTDRARFAAPVTDMKQQSITNLPLSPDEERRRRMIK